MKIALFGGTGALGQQVITQGLAAGYQIRALARTPSKLDSASERLEVIQGDALDLESATRVVHGQDVVICVVGAASIKDSTTRTRITENIIEAMQSNPEAKLLICSAVGVGDSINHYSFINKMFGKLVLKNVLADHSSQESAVQKSNLNWVIVRAAPLNNKELTESYRLAEDKEIFRAKNISRADVAHFLLRAAKETTWDSRAMTLTI